MLNIFSSHLMAILNNVSVWWHVVGATVIVLILIFVPDQHQSFSYVFTERFNNSGYSGGSTSSFGFWFAVVPFGFLLTQYTITGFDASAHLSEETAVGVDGGGQGHLALDLLLGARWLHPAALLSCSPSPRRSRTGRRTTPASARGGVAYIFTQSMGNNWATLVLFISASAQVFCATSCMTSASRMTFAFSRDGAIPGSKRWSTLTAKRVPANAVMLVAVCRAIVTLPALIEVNLGHRRRAADHPGRVLRGDLDRGHRAVPRVRHPDLAALAARRQVRGRRLEQRLEVQVDEPDRGRRDRHRVART